MDVRYREMCPAIAERPGETIICGLDKGHHGNHLDLHIGFWFLFFYTDIEMVQKMREAFRGK